MIKTDEILLKKKDTSFHQRSLISVFQIWFNVYLLTSLHDAIWLMNIHEQKYPWFLAMTDKLYHIMLYRVSLAWTRFELATLVVIGNDFIGSHNSNYHTKIDHDGLSFVLDISIHVLIVSINLPRIVRISHKIIIRIKIFPCISIK